MEPPALGLLDGSAESIVKRHLARELHDSVVQTLQLMLVEMEQFKAQKFDELSVVSHVSEYQAQTRDVLQELRQMLYELRDESIVEIGFADAMRSLVAAFQARTGIRAQISITPAWPADVRRSAAHQVQRIIEEALNNVRRHSAARRCSVLLGQASARNLLILVRDNGVGMAWGTELAHAGVGLSGMRERVVLLGGELSVVPAIGGGTVLRAVFPKESVR